MQKRLVTDEEFSKARLDRSYESSILRGYRSWRAELEGDVKMVTRGIQKQDRVNQ